MSIPYFLYRPFGAEVWNLVKWPDHEWEKYLLFSIFCSCRKFVITFWLSVDPLPKPSGSRLSARKHWLQTLTFPPAEQNTDGCHSSREQPQTGMACSRSLWQPPPWYASSLGLPPVWNWLKALPPAPIQLPPLPPTYLILPPYLSPSLIHVSIHLDKCALLQQTTPHKVRIFNRLKLDILMEEEKIASRCTNWKCRTLSCIFFCMVCWKCLWS